MKHMQEQQQQTANSTPQLPLILALDVGTSSTRALLFDATGMAVEGMVAQDTYELTISNEGEVSVDADKLVEAVAVTIDKVLKTAGPLASSISAVATDTFWHSLVGVDAAGRAVTPLITWEDTRPRQAATELGSQLDRAAVHQRTGARLHASYWPAKLRWLATTQPDAFARAAQWLSFGEYLHRQLLGRSVCSLSMASGTGMLVTRSRTWDTELMHVLDVRAEQLPPLGDVHDSITGLTPAYASRWPLLQKVPWFPAIGDGAAANVGSGCAVVGNWALTIGTSSALRLVVSPEQVVLPPGLWLYLLDARRALLGGALSEGGNMFAWLSKTLQISSLKDAEEQVATLPPDGHGLTVLPFISGERSPGWHAEARAVIAGVQTRTSPLDVLRACMEALAYQLEAVYFQLQLALKMGENKPRLIGSGGALLASATLQQIIADTLTVPLYPSYEHEASARGVALLALEGLNILPDVSQVLPKLAEPVQPDVKRGEVYREGAERQQKLYSLLLGAVKE
ncbi:MAG: gluconokinase [Ktedonobacteraceae bacterium]